MYDFIRTAAAVPEVSVGDVHFNVNEINTFIEKLSDADVIVFPELALTGYTCGDLFFQESLLEGVLDGIRSIAEKSMIAKGIISVGAPIKIEGQLYNCGVVISKGRVMGISVKTALAEYGGNYEKRWFSSAAELCTDEISSEELRLGGEYNIPVGNDLVYKAGKIKLALEIGEDLLSPVPVSTNLCLNGAELIVNSGAYGAENGKKKYITDFIKHQSAALLCGYVFTSAGESESTTDLVYAGTSVICENGKILKQNKRITDGGYYIEADIDMGKIKADRLKIKSFKDGVSESSPCRIIDTQTETGSDGELYTVEKFPFIPQSEAEREEACMEIFNIQVASLKRRMKKIGSKPVVGVSGGLDSTLALLVSVQAVKELGMDTKSVTAITLPCFGTTKRTHGNAWKLMESLNVKSLEIDIKNACTLHCKDIGHPENKFDVTYENIQARERTQVLMDYSCKTGGFVVGTGDLSELSLGWCTYNADHMSMYGVNAGVPKTLIRWIIKAVINRGLFPGSREVLMDIIDTPISPELLPPDENGNIVQETEEIIGPYALNDFFMYYLLRYGFSPSKIYFLAQKAFADEYDGKTILKWLKIFYRRFFTQQFKRNCLPDGAKAAGISLSPRGDWKMPGDASYRLWLSEIEKLS